MSNLPSFLPETAPSTSIVVNGPELSSDEISYLNSQINALHFRPTIVVLNAQYHVQDGDAMVAQLAEKWSLDPHGMIVIYSPADKQIWSTFGSFNSSVGAYPSFFNNNFSQRLGSGNREGSLSAALDLSLQDMDRFIVRSSGVASQSTAHHRHHLRDSHGAGATGTAGGENSAGGQVLPAFFLAVLTLVVIGKIVGVNGPRKRLTEDPPRTDGLSSDVDRILRVMQGTQTGSEAGSSRIIRPTNTQVPMAEFKKRADHSSGSGAQKAGKKTSPVYRPGNSSVDAADKLQAAIDSSAAKVREEHKQKVASEQSNLTAPGDLETPAAVVQDGKFIDSYVASFGTDSVDKPRLVAQEAAPETIARTVQEILKAPSVVRQDTPVAEFSSARLQVNPVVAAALEPTLISERSPILVQPGAASAGSSLDLSSFSLEAASAPFAHVLGSMGTPLDEMKTSGGGALPLGSLTSFDSSAEAFAAQAVVSCPNCAEPKSKDFSFCLKCGHNF